MLALSPSLDTSTVNPDLPSRSAEPSAPQPPSPEPTATAPDKPAVGATALAQAQDVAVATDVRRVLQELGVQTLRVSRLDTQSFEFQWARSITAQGDVHEADANRPLDSVFPGGSAAVAEITRRAGADISVQKHSPRRWLLAWGAEHGQANLVDAQFYEKRDTLSDLDTALLRLVCHISTQQVQAADADDGTSPNHSALVWPQVERRAKSATSVGPALAWALMLCSVLACAWLALVAAPQAGQQAAARQADFIALRDGTMGRGLSAALATGDYGEVQSALQTFAELGHFQSAVVVNDKQRSVAIVGAVKNQRIGEPVAPAYAQSATSLKLTTGSQQQGQLLFVAMPVAEGTGVGSGLGRVAVLALLLSLALTALTALQLWRQHRADGRS
jgi:hypothetical protein